MLTDGYLKALPFGLAIIIYMRASNAETVFDIKTIFLLRKILVYTAALGSQRSSEYTKVTVCGIKTDLFLLLFIGFEICVSVGKI